MTAPTPERACVWYHGGPSGISGWILPPSKTGAQSTADVVRNMDTAHVRRDRVFITTDRVAATMFACVWPDPMVYVVEPDGEIEPDPDYHHDDGASVQVERARILRWIKPRWKGNDILGSVTRGIVRPATGVYPTLYRSRTAAPGRADLAGRGMGWLARRHRGTQRGLASERRCS